MDISKLPKFSKSDPPPPNEPVPGQTQSEASPLYTIKTTGPAQPPIADRAADNRAADNRLANEPLPGLAEAWISIVIGLILLFAFPRTIQYFHSPASFNENYSPTDTDGSPMPYVKTAYFLADLGVTVFAVALLFEGAALVVSKKVFVVWAAFVLTAAATAFNLYALVRTYNLIGFQIVCALAVAVGGYMAMSHLRLIQILNQRASYQKK